MRRLLVTAAGGHAFEIDVVRFQDGSLHVLTAKIPPPPDPSQVSDCGVYVEDTDDNRCTNATATASARTREVVVTLRRSCLHDPAWVQAGVEVYGGRHTVYFDEWRTRGSAPDADGFVYGPRVRSG